MEEYLCELRELTRWAIEASLEFADQNRMEAAYCSGSPLVRNGGSPSSGNGRYPNFLNTNVAPDFAVPLTPWRKMLRLQVRMAVGTVCCYVGPRVEK